MACFVGIVATVALLMFRLLTVGLLMFRLLMLVRLTGDLVMFNGLRLGVRIGLAGGRAVTRNVAAADVAFLRTTVPVLSESGGGANQTDGQKAQ